MKFVVLSGLKMRPVVQKLFFFLCGGPLKKIISPSHLYMVYLNFLIELSGVFLTL